MHPYRWTGDLTVFQPEFDAEHREVLRLCEDLHCAVQAGAESGAVQETIRQLAAELEAHFGHEEREMREKRLPGYEWHKRQHDTARRRFQTLAESAPDEVAAFVASWVRDHAGVADRMMASALRNASLAPAARGRQALTATKKVRPSPKSPAIPRSPAS